MQEVRLVLCIKELALSFTLQLHPHCQGTSCDDDIHTDYDWVCNKGTGRYDCYGVNVAG